jgi:hypothetical protein
VQVEEGAGVVLVVALGVGVRGQPDEIAERGEAEDDGDVVGDGPEDGGRPSVR